MQGLIAGGADILLIETVFDTLNAKAAIYAANQVNKTLEDELPLIISGTVTDASGRTLSGQTCEAFLYSIEHANPLAVGLNCALGAEQLRPYVAELSKLCSTAVSVHPNAGLPDAFGEYTQTPEQMTDIVREFAESGWLNLIGGCCGTTPEHISAIAEAMAEFPPRTLPERQSSNTEATIELLKLSGLEPLKLQSDSLFVNVGERTNVTGSARFARLIRENKFDEALNVARQQVENGAQIIDINMDEGMLDGEQAMVHFLNLIASEPDISRVPIMLDSSKWDIIEAGLKCVQGKAIVNSISLKEGEEAFIAAAQKCLEYGAAIGLEAISDQSDGYYFLVHTFPSDKTVDEVFEEMTRHIRVATGMAEMRIREKMIALQSLALRGPADCDARVAHEAVGLVVAPHADGRHVEARHQAVDRRAAQARVRRAQRRAHVDERGLLPAIGRR